jgi:ABC-type cobalamin transport system ATPase subunit
MMGDYKRTVKNKARVEGSICMSYLQRETTYFCSHYFKTVSLYARSQRNEAARLNDVTTTLSISNQLGRPSGKPQTHWLSDAEKRSAHVHILINCNEVKPYIE